MTIRELRDYLTDPGKRALRFFPFQVAEATSDLAALLLYDLDRRIGGQKHPLIKDRLIWTYDTLETFSKNHPYASEAGVRKAFIALEKEDLIRIEKSGKYNKKGYDRKWWYHVTPKGRKGASRWLMRFDLAVAVERGIPGAVILEHFRHEWHSGPPKEYVTIDPTTLKVPYSPRTIRRCLDGLVTEGILTLHEGKKGRYATCAPIQVDGDWQEPWTPISVPSSKLLPHIERGSVGILTGPSGGGKTSLATFIAIQFALEGKKVLFVSLEEPVENIVQRMYAQEFGINYSALHGQRSGALKRLNDCMATPSDRKTRVGMNLKLLDMSGRRAQTHELLDEIEGAWVNVSEPDVLIIDQLEWISVQCELDEKGGDWPAPGF